MVANEKPFPPDAARRLEEIKAAIAGIITRAEIADAIGIAEQAQGGSAAALIRHMAREISDSAFDLREAVANLSDALL